MTETEQSKIAKARYQELLASKPTFVLGEVATILEVAGMNDGEISGAITNGKIVNPIRGAKKNVAYYSPSDVVKLYFAGILAREERARLEEKNRAGDYKFMWKNIDKGKITGMMMSSMAERLFEDNLGQLVVSRMFEVAGLESR